MFVSKRKYNELEGYYKDLATKNFLLELEIKKLKKPVLKKTVKKVVK
jgi:hypothetical protein